MRVARSRTAMLAFWKDGVATHIASRGACTPSRSFFSARTGGWRLVNTQIGDCSCRKCAKMCFGPNLKVTQVTVSPWNFTEYNRRERRILTNYVRNTSWLTIANTYATIWPFSRFLKTILHTFYRSLVIQVPCNQQMARKSS